MAKLLMVLREVEGFESQEHVASFLQTEPVRRIFQFYFDPIIDSPYQVQVSDRESDEGHTFYYVWLMEDGDEDDSEP